MVKDHNYVEATCLQEPSRHHRLLGAFEKNQPKTKNIV